MKLFSLIIIVIFSFQNVLPCSCSNTSVAESTQILKTQDAVFEGKVISISPPKEFVYPTEDFLEIEFEVEKSWKGIDSKKIIIRSYPKTNSCSINFEVGETALIVAKGKPLKTDMCIRGNIESSKFSEIFGAPKVFEEEPPEETEISKGFWLKMWSKIISFFS